MKKMWMVLAFAGTLALLFASPLFAQWEAPIRLTQQDSISYTNFNNNGWAVAASGDTVHVVWFDKRPGKYEIYYKRSLDGGSTWGSDTRLSFTSNYDSSNPSVAVSGLQVHVVWEEYFWMIRYKRSTDGGATWRPDTLLRYGSNPSVAVSGSNVSVVLESDALESNWIYWMRSTNDGGSWATFQLPSNNVASPSATVLDSRVHIVWTGKWKTGGSDLNGTYYQQYDGVTGDSITSRALLSHESENG